VLEKALMEKGRKICLDQRTKAESDFAVAAASILAREKFIGWLEEAGGKAGVKLPRGVSATVKAAATQIVSQNGPGALENVREEPLQDGRGNFRGPPERVTGVRDGAHTGRELFEREECLLEVVRGRSIPSSQGISTHPAAVRFLICSK